LDKGNRKTAVPGVYKKKKFLKRPIRRDTQRGDVEKSLAEARTGKKKEREEVILLVQKDRIWLYPGGCPRLREMHDSMPACDACSEEGKKKSDGRAKKGDLQTHNGPGTQASLKETKDENEAENSIAFSRLQLKT